ncbi:LuxR family transcriptional regulator [Phycicoccus ginsengisoli]
MLAGRGVERAQVADVIDAARQGHGGALVVRGVAGSGKSTLLADTVAGIADMTVLRTSGVESESPLAFAALQRLLWPVRDHIDQLPPPQQAALRTALGEAAGDGDRFLTFLGTLSLLAEVAEQRPVVAVVDDAHWLDDASTAALLFAARRLHAEPVVVLFAARDGDARRFDAPDVPSVVLGGLAGADADAVLSGAEAGVDPSVRDQLVHATGGNPLALVELANALSPEQLAGTQPLPQPLPLTGGVERAFLERYRQLPEAAQQFLLVAAADDTGRVTVVRDAAHAVGADDDAADAAERAGLLSMNTGRVSMYHPLVRSAVYQAATSSSRRSAHRALADALVDDPDRRAWHLAAAVDRPDGDVVAALDGVAERAAGRGGHEAAAAAWARAAELTTDSQDRGRRLLLAASSAWLGAHPSQAAAFATAAEAHVTDPAMRIQLLTLQGQVTWNAKSLNDGYDLILQAAQLAAETSDPATPQLAMLAASLAGFGARSPRPVDPLALAPPPQPGASAHTLAADALLHGFVALSRKDWPTAADRFERAHQLTENTPAQDHLLQPNLAIAAWLMDDDERSLRLHDEQLTTARRAGALSMMEHALTRGFYAQVATGAWTQAAAAAAEALPLAASTGHPGMTALPTAELALVAALRGDKQGAADGVQAAQTIRAKNPIGITDSLVQDLIHWTEALLSWDRPETALHHLDQLTIAAVRRLAAPDVFDLAARANRRDVIDAWLAETDAFAVGTRLPAATALLEHGRALTADDDDAEQHFQAALAAHARSPRTPNRARTELAYGQWLRRCRRRVDARTHLRAALTVFEDIGAAPLADVAAQELRASGETARRRDVSTATDLTGQERQVAALVRQGLSNKDVAARLFVSPRTVDFHLRNVFTKLGVSSRAELTALQLDV